MKKSQADALWREHCELVRFLVDHAIKWHQTAQAYKARIAELEAALPLPPSGVA